MSGSGGFGGYELPARAKFDCLTGTITVKVSSIELETLAHQSMADILEVEISNANVLILVDGNGRTLGSVMHVHTSDLINCIERGNRYSAEIVNIAPPTCTVKIQKI